jgi:hypothetical protein
MVGGVGNVRKLNRLEQRLGQVAGFHRLLQPTLVAAQQHGNPTHPSLRRQGDNSGTSLERRVVASNAISSVQLGAALGVRS